MGEMNAYGYGPGPQYMETVNEQPRIKKIMTNRVKKTFVKDSPIR